ncbi:MAG: hypothetical protein IKD11_02615 [Oscillospiraceae bacterium]|nr:hypothetical protein [Oscillospiraceae bacterium]
MFGYVLPAKDKLSEEDLARFQSLYCGLCHTMGREYGFFSRFFLNYDFTFLAMLLSDSDEPLCAQCRCVAHPIKKRCAAQRSAALEAAASRSIVLAWWQLTDHINDSGFFAAVKYRLIRFFLRRAYRKARADAPNFDRMTELQLKALGALEKQNCPSLDEAAEPFAALMAAMAADIPDVRKRRVLTQLFYHMGRWIYLVDAADDLKKDNESGNYNPLRYRYGICSGGLTQEAKAALAGTLDQSIMQMAAAYELGDFGVWTSTLNAVFYAGLYSVGNSVLNEMFHHRDSVCRKRRNEEELL